MSVADVAGLIAAIVFAVLVGLCAIPLIKLGRVFDETTAAIKDLTEHTIPVIDETLTTVAATNTQLEKVDVITTSVAEVSENVSALTALFAATVGSPIIKVAAFTYGVRSAMSGKNKDNGKARKAGKKS